MKEEIRSSHVLYMILNQNGSLYLDRNGDLKIYKTKNGLKQHYEKYKDKKVAVFTLTDINEIHDILGE